MMKLCILMFVFGLLSFSLSSNHLLSMLISLEFMVLMVFFSLVMNISLGGLYFSMMFLIFTVCEGALGLTILVGMSRVFGGDYLTTFSLSV